MVHRLPSVLIAAAAVAGCDGVAGPSVAQAPASFAAQACDPDERLEFPVSPGGTLEASPALVRAHACALRIVAALQARTVAPAPPIRRHVTREDIAAHVADRDRVRWTKAATLMLHGTQACVDGRDAHAIIGTPGGDAGEFVLSLAAAEHLGGASFDPQTIGQIFDAYLEAFGHFYLHSDTYAVAALLDRVEDERPDLDLPATSDLAATERFLRAPPASIQPLLLDLVARPDLVGCGHLRLMLQHPDAYGVRAELVADVLRTVFARLWAGSAAIEFVVLEGAHEESAVVSIELANEVHGFTRIPLVSPRLRDTEVFVTHPQVARFVRRENAAFLLQQARLPHMRDLDEAAFYGALEQLAERQLRATLAHLAPALPHYVARFDGDTFAIDGPMERP